MELENRIQEWETKLKELSIQKSEPRKRDRGTSLEIRRDRLIPTL
jgi:hypothetical protein